MGDANNRGGLITFPNNFNVFANSRLVAVGPSLVAPHPKCPVQLQHCAAVTIPISSVYINGLAVVAQHDFDTCFDIRVLGSSNVFVGP
jgi:hypothetical protein